MLALIIIGSIIGYLCGIGIAASIMLNVFNWRHDNDGYFGAFLCGTFWPLTMPISCAYLFSQLIAKKVKVAKQKRILLQKQMRVEIEKAEKEVEEILQQENVSAVYQERAR